MPQGKNLFATAIAVNDASGNPILGIAYYMWDPMPDITTFEFCQCHPILHGEHNLISTLPLNCLRHFRSVENPYAS